jgi:DMSO/TMAO reductase YedYZ molybdopterin-dependent catalytic subunit
MRPEAQALYERLFGSKERDAAVADRIPPGQYRTEKFPVLHYGSVPKTDLATWDFKVYGLVDSPFTLTWDQFKALPRKIVGTDIHCVTRWTKLDTTWQGVSLDTLLADVETAADFALVHSYGGYTTNLPLEDLLDGKAWVAFEYEGDELAPEHGGPARLLVPHLYFWKSAKWVSGLDLVLQDEPGFWEQLGYHDYGDPWREQRYQGD